MDNKNFKREVMMNYTQMIHRGLLKDTSTLVRDKEIEIETMDLWLKQGTIKEVSRGSENIYFTDQFDNGFFCKCL